MSSIWQGGGGNEGSGWVGCICDGRWRCSRFCYKYSSSRACLSASRSAWQDIRQKGMLCFPFSLRQVMLALFYCHAIKFSILNRSKLTERDTSGRRQYRQQADTANAVTGVKEGYADHGKKSLRWGRNQLCSFR